MSTLFIGGFDWTPVDIAKTSKRGGYNHTEKKVTITTKTHPQTGKQMVSRLKISSALIKELGWKEKDRVRLFSHGTMFMLCKENSALTIPITPTSKKGENVAFYVGDINVARTIHAKAQCLEFEAWVEDTSLIFKPKTKQE